MKLQLIQGWQDFWRMWSVRLNFIGAAILLYLQEVPNAAITIWTHLPGDIKSVLPTQFVQYIGYGLIVAGLFARVVRQQKLNDRNEARKEHETGVGSTPERNT